MLLEALEYLTTPCPPEARRLGLLAESVALGARFRRQQRRWQPHIEATQRFITEAAERAAPGGTALVAGSGRLIEIPLEALAARFRTVVLADIVHPWPVRLRAALLGNVRLATIDLTGTLPAVAAALRERRPPPPSDAPAALASDGFSLAVSCNLLSQLPLMPLDAAERCRSPWDAAERTSFARRLLLEHIAWLRGIAPVAALYTDRESHWIDAQGATVAQEDSLWGLELPPPDRLWGWDIAPAPEADRRLDLRHLVAGWLDLNAVTSRPEGTGPEADQSQPPPSLPPPSSPP